MLYPLRHHAACKEVRDAVYVFYRKMHWTCWKYTFLNWLKLRFCVWCRDSYCYGDKSSNVDWWTLLSTGTCSDGWQLGTDERWYSSLYLCWVATNVLINKTNMKLFHHGCHETACVRVKFVVVAAAAAIVVIAMSSQAMPTWGSRCPEEMKIPNSDVLYSRVMGLPKMCFHSAVYGHLRS